jgi:hypothetical protein
MGKYLDKDIIARNAKIIRKVNSFVYKGFKKMEAIKMFAKKSYRSHSQVYSITYNTNNSQTVQSAQDIVNLEIEKKNINPYYC